VSREIPPGVIFDDIDDNLDHALKRINAIRRNVNLLKELAGIDVPECDKCTGHSCDKPKED